MEWRPAGEKFFEVNVEWCTPVMAFANSNQKTRGGYFEHMNYDLYELGRDELDGWGRGEFNLNYHYHSDNF